MNKIRIVRNTVNEVMIVRLNVSLIDLLIVSGNVRFGCSLRFSRILSKMITASFIEKPITVNIAAIKCWSISSGNGTIFLAKEKTINVTSTSCIRATIVPTEYLQSRNRMKIYIEMISNDQKVAH